MRLIQQIWHGKSEELCQRFQAKRQVACIITDPPFGVDNQSNQAVTQAGKEHARKIENDETPEIAIATFKRVMDVLLPATKDECDMYVFTSYQVLEEWLAMTREYLAPFGFYRKAILTWEKEGPGMGDTNSPWGMGCEFILFFQKGGRDKTGIRRNPVIHIPQVRPGDLIHPHEKPEALYELFIKQSTSKGDFIVDPFGGSGVLARACRRTDRSGVAVESNQHNWELATKKFETQGDSLF